MRTPRGRAEVGFLFASPEQGVDVHPESNVLLLRGRMLTSSTAGEQQAERGTWSYTWYPIICFASLVVRLFVFFSGGDKKKRHILVPRPIFFLVLYIFVCGFFNSCLSVTIKCRPFFPMSLEGGFFFVGVGGFVLPGDRG